MSRLQNVAAIILAAGLLGMVQASTSNTANATTNGQSKQVISGPPTDPAAIAAKKQSEMANLKYSGYLTLGLLASVCGLLAWSVVMRGNKHIRTLASLNNATQAYFTTPSDTFASIKKHILYAPIFRKRHNRECHLSGAVNLGSFPTRFQFGCLSAYMAVNIVLLVLRMDFTAPVMISAKAVRNRAGTLAVINMLPLFALAGRNNPLINALGISFDSFNLVHRWVGRMVVFQALLHGLSHVYAYIREYGAELGWSSVRKDIAAGEFITYGFVALVCLIIILIQSTSVVRHAFYETFKIAHIVLVSVIIAMLYFHMDMHDMPQIKSIYTIISIWVVERIIRCARVVYRNVGNGGTSALVEALPDGACRLTVDMARPWTFKAGQHAYLYMPGLSWLQSHPFSVAWSEEVDTMHEEKNSITHHDVLAKRKAKMCFIIRARTGFTHNLFKLAEAANGQKIAVRCMLEGPYGALHSMHSYGTVLLFAGGVGITHQVPFVRDLVTGYANGTVAARKIVLVWTIKQGSHLEWIRPWMTSILQLDRRRECLKIQLFISRPGSNKEVHSPSATVQMFPGRPNIPAIMDCEMETQIGTMGVSVCGPGAFSDDVRSAVRQRQHTRNVEFVEEAFTW